MDKTKLLFVCLGNICRSPSAEAIMKDLVAKRGLAHKYYIESAGTMGYHEGNLPDKRSRKHGAARGYVLDSLARRVTTDDFYHFDVIVGMDDSNIEALKQKAPDVGSKDKIKKMANYLRKSSFDHIPDPYYEGASGFELVLDLLEEACNNLLDQLEVAESKK